MAKTFSVAVSQARYVNRIYGVPDGFDGLLHDLPANTPSNRFERLLKILIYSCGGVIFHFFENSALLLYIIRRCDPEKIPRTKAWLVKRGSPSKYTDFILGALTSNNMIAIFVVVIDLGSALSKLIIGC